MVAVKTPLLSLKLDPQAALYVAILERQIVALTINDAKYRALLEMLTGDTWDDLVTDFEAGELRKLAIAHAQEKLNMDFLDAAKYVRQNEARANNTPIEPEGTPTDTAATAPSVS